MKHIYKAFFEQQIDNDGSDNRYHITAANEHDRIAAGNKHGIYPKEMMGVFTGNDGNDYFLFTAADGQDWMFITAGIHDDDAESIFTYGDWDAVTVRLAAVKEFSGFNVQMETLPLPWDSV